MANTFLFQLAFTATSVLFFGEIQANNVRSSADTCDVIRQPTYVAEVKKILSQPTSVTEIADGGDGGCVIRFSNGEEIRFDRREMFPVFKIGGNGCWTVCGRETAFKVSEFPNPHIGDNGNWWIDGADTGISKGDGFITGVAETPDGRVKFFFDDGTSAMMCGPSIKRIASWGDSLTPKYVPWLAYLLGAEYEVVDCGVPGETTTEIAGRQGGIPIKLGRDITMPAKAGEKVGIGTDLVNCDYLLTSYEIPLRADEPHNDRWYNNFNYIRPFRQNPDTGDLCINPCVIDGVECRITREGGTGWYKIDSKYFIERTADGSPVILPAGSIVCTSAMRNLRNLYANIFFMGQNNGFTLKDGREDVNILIDQYRRMIDYSGSDRYVIITFPYRAKRIGDTEIVSDELIAIEKRLQEEFGNHVINLRHYFSTLDLEAAHVTPMPGDEERMNNGLCPKALLNNNGKDPVHFNDKGYQLLAGLIRDKLRGLGYIK